MLGIGKVFEAIELGRFTPKMVKSESLGAGEVGYFISNIKRLGDVKIGDTLALHKGPKSRCCPATARRSRWSSPTSTRPTTATSRSCAPSLETLSLTDARFTYEPVTSDALGFGFRCGFLGLLHMEIIQERLEREFDLDMIQTAPTVTYRIVRHDGTSEEIHSAGTLPTPTATRSCSSRSRASRS
jgi:GTP-binding protein LepA